ncbi:hypothetical protein PENSTE_c009G03866 [Penicillium steckii]|uniref:Uncharacterized protein n=1 Tax=Penicillium steckii TaxID=303698 RepID=A0A1V6T9G8_9EURO|nr:hypothetical protein PENSTE_c009G03866 [Penicillium steckii]
MSAQQNESNTANDVQQPTLDDLRYSQPEGKMRAIPIHYEVLLSRYALDFSQIDPELVREVCEELERIACDYFNDEVSGEFEQTIEDHYDAFARACINYLDSLRGRDPQTDYMLSRGEDIFLTTAKQRLGRLIAEDYIVTRRERFPEISSNLGRVEAIVFETNYQDVLLMNYEEEKAEDLFFSDL